MYWLQLISLIVMWIVIVINVVLIFKNKIVGDLILLEEEGENQTYAFMELHEPMEKIKRKRTVNLKIEKRSR